jgi:hypothetical protein
MLNKRSSFCGVLFGAFAAASHAVVVYQNDFETSSAPEFTPAPFTLAPNSSTTFLGRFSGDNPGTVLNLTGLAAHSSITLNFDVYIIQSWDGTGNAGFGPDILRFTADSNTFLDASFSNRSGPTQSYSDATPLGGGPFPEKTGTDAENTLGYVDSFGTNTVYNLSFTFAHSASTLTVDFGSIGLQAVGDESWGLDNFVVDANSDPVPEPASLAALGLGVVALLRKRARKAA